MTTETKKMSLVDAMKHCTEYYNSEQYTKCIDLANQIIKSIPGHTDASFISALCYIALAEYDKAEQLLNHCAKQIPDHPKVLFNIGRLYVLQSRNKEAIAAYKKVLSIDPGDLGSLNNLANIYNELGQGDIALEYFHRVLEVDKTQAFVYNNISLIYKKQGLLNKSLEYVQKAINLNPMLFEPYRNAALVCILCAKNSKAIECYKRAIQIKPDDIITMQEYHDALRKVCGWKERAILGKRLDILKEEAGEDFVGASVVDIQENEDPLNALDCARTFTKELVKAMQEAHTAFIFDHSRKNKNKKKIRIGYISSDIKDHPVAHLMRGVFKSHNKNDFEIYLYSFSTADTSGYQKAIASYCTKFIDINNDSNYATAQRIYNDNIDILIDLNGHTGAERVEALSLKPAPIQVNYLGFIGTMGADFIDYIITDKIVTPPEHQQYYDEKFVYLPNCYQANDNTLEISNEEITRASEGLPDDAFIFCSLNQTYKIEPVMFDVWMNILKRVPNSVLWLYRGSIYEDDNLAEQNLRAEAKERGVDPNRLFFAHSKKINQHLKRTGLADLALDTRLYNGGTVTSQTLWAGVPVITLQGEQFSSRMASSILNAVGLGKLVTTSKQAYEDLAVEIASSPNKIIALKQELQTNIKTLPLFNTEQFTQHLEQAYKMIWDNYCDGNQTRSLEVSQ